MKVSIIALLVCALMFCSVGMANAASLEDRVSALENRGGGALDGVTIGGHLKMYMYDQSTGEVTNSAGVKTNQHNNISAGMSHLYIYVGKELSDIVNVHASFDVGSVRAGATPSLGNSITRSVNSLGTGLHEAYMSVLLPEDYELKAGFFNARFSEEYATEAWWHENYNQNNLCYLQSIGHDTGVEVYKNFDLDEFSLPVWISLLNGNGSRSHADSNDNKMFIVHVAPEFQEGALRFPLAYAKGTRDTEDDFDRTSMTFGVNYTVEQFNLSAEFYDHEYEKVTTTQDGDRTGYFLKGLYTIDDQWTAIVKLMHTELYNTGGTVVRTDEYDELLLGINFNITESSTIMPSVTIVTADRTGSTVAAENNEKLEYVRWNLGWRTTF